MLREWCEITAEEYLEYVDIIPHPDELILKKLKGGGIMTDNCVPAQSLNRRLAAIVDEHSMYCHHHQRNIWIKWILNDVGDFVSALIKDNLDEVVPEFRVSPRFETMCRTFDKDFFLCANYPKGWGLLFHSCTKENHSGELLFHVERACKGRHDVVLMASMAIHWNRNYCVTFLDQI